MAGSKPDPKSRHPVVFASSPRRRLVRRPSIARSTTAPNLRIESATANSVSGTATKTIKKLNAASVATPSPALRENMNFYSPLGGLPENLRSEKPRPSDTFTRDSRGSPNQLTVSVATAATEGKKKHGFFGTRTKSYDQHTIPYGPITSPLPSVTSSKAAQLLGVDGFISPVRAMFTRNDPVPLLNEQKSKSSRYTKFTEEGVEPDLPKSKGFWGSSGKAMRVLDILPRSSKRVEDRQPGTAIPWSPSVNDVTDSTYSADRDRYGHSTPTPSTPSTLSNDQRRPRKKGPKSLQRMTPITETSYDELNTAYRNSAHDTELDVISEYERIYPLRTTSFLPRSHTEALLTSTFKYGLADGDLSPTDCFYDEEKVEGEDKEDKHVMHPGTQVNLNQLDWQDPAVMRLRSPLQAVEDRLLDAAELDLKMRRRAQQRLEADRLKHDNHVAMLRASNEEAKKILEVSKHHKVGPIDPGGFHECECSENVDDDDDADEGLVSLRSSMDLNEEPTVHVTKVMTFTRITPGMVKLVDILSRRKPVVAPATSGPIRSPLFPKHEKQQVKLCPVHDEHFDRATMPRKAKLPRSESQLQSQLLVQDWMLQHDVTKQRPISERIDLDVLADQQIAPAPVPKDDRPAFPARQSSKEDRPNLRRQYGSL